MSRPLGRIEPPDKVHVERFPLTALAPEAHPTNHPVVIGVPWYTAFDSPVQGSDGKYRLPSANADLGTVRGGHCVCLEPASVEDEAAWWEFYNQGQEGACEGFGHARALSLIYRRKFDAFWLYDDARRAEGTYPEGEGTTNRATCDALRRWGCHYSSGEVAERHSWSPRVPGVEIRANRWMTNAAEVLAVLGHKATEEVALLNSWGSDYPEVVYLPADTLDRLLHESGEADTYTQR